MLTKGTILHSLYRGILIFASFAIVMAFQGNPQWGEITLGSLAATIVHYIASKLEQA